MNISDINNSIWPLTPKTQEIKLGVQSSLVYKLNYF